MSWTADNSELLRYKSEIEFGKIIAGEWLWKELRNLEEDLRHNDAYIYNTDDALLRMDFMQNCIRLTKSPFYNMPMVLMQWQKAFIEALYSFKLAREWAEGKNIDCAESMEDRDAGGGKDGGTFSAKGKGKLKDKIHTANHGGLSARVFVGDGHIASLRKVSAHHRDNTGIRAVPFSDLLDLVCVSPVKGVVFRNNSDGRHTPKGLLFFE